MFVGWCFASNFSKDTTLFSILLHKDYYKKDCCLLLYRYIALLLNTHCSVECLYLICSIFLFGIFVIRRIYKEITKRFILEIFDCRNSGMGVQMEMIWYRWLVFGFLLNLAFNCLVRRNICVHNWHRNCCNDKCLLRKLYDWTQIIDAS